MWLVQWARVVWQHAIPHVLSAKAIVKCDQFASIDVWGGVEEGWRRKRRRDCCQISEQWIRVLITLDYRWKTGALSRERSVVIRICFAQKSDSMRQHLRFLLIIRSYLPWWLSAPEEWKRSMAITHSRLVHFRSIVSSNRQIKSNVQR